MLDPNICKRVDCFVDVAVIGVRSGLMEQFATYQGVRLEILHRKPNAVKPGKRRLYLKYSIINDQYYLSDRSH